MNKNPNIKIDPDKHGKGVEQIEHILTPLVCLRCGFGKDPNDPWIQRKLTSPKVCPRCHSAYWDRKRREK